MGFPGHSLSQLAVHSPADGKHNMASRFPFIQIYKAGELAAISGYQIRLGRRQISP